VTDPEDIRGWQRLTSRITTSGRVEDGDPARLAAIGVAHVITLAMADHPEALAEEEGKLAAQGIRYTHIPVPFDAPTAAHYAAFFACAAIGAENRVEAVEPEKPCRRRDRHRCSR